MPNLDGGSPKLLLKLEHAWLSTPPSENDVINHPFRKSQLTSINMVISWRRTELLFIMCIDKNEPCNKYHTYKSSEY